MLKVELKLVCAACPEMYNAYIEGQYVGYLRLRNGWFSVMYKGREDESSEVYYDDMPDNLQGSFDSPEQRHEYLNEGCEALLRVHQREHLRDSFYEITGEVDDY